jgi:hypothetical protein
MESKRQIVKSNYFYIKRNKLGDNIIIEFKDNIGRVWQYDHDLVYKALKNHFDTMPCFINKNEYTSTNSVPGYIQVLDCVKIISKS